MNLFKFIKKHRLCKEDSNKIERVVSNFESLNQVMSPLDEVFFESNTLVSLTENNFLDTTSPLKISMYKCNLKLLIEQKKQRGYIDSQLLAANQICSILVKDMDFENNHNNTVTI